MIFFEYPIFVKCNHNFEDTDSIQEVVIYKKLYKKKIQYRDTERVLKEIIWQG